jgi:hypothetical protein
MPTLAGEKVVKLASNESEGPFALANELIGTGMAERLGLWQPARWIVEVPMAIARAAGWTPRLVHRLGLGTDLDEAFKAELNNEAVIAGVRPIASGHSILATLVLIDWLRLGDHSTTNFVFKDGHFIPIDFASAPGEDVWRHGRGTPIVSQDPGGLRSELGRVTRTEAAGVLRLFDRVDSKVLRRIVAKAPIEWTQALTENTVSVLVATKQEVRDAYWP